MIETGTFADRPDFRDTDFVVLISAAAQYGTRWYYAATEQEALPAISAAGDATPAPLYDDHPTPRTMVLPTTAGGPYLTEINNRQLSVGDLVRVRHKTETTDGTLYEAEAAGAAGGGVVVDHLTTGTVAHTLTTSWTNIGASLTLPANTTWLLHAQLNAQIVSSSSGAGDSISCRFYDGSAVAGCPVEFCDAVCDSLTYVDAASLVAVYTAGSGGATINIQGIVNTSTASTGSILGSGALAGGQLVGVRLS